MFLFKKIVTPFFLLPGVFVFLLISFSGWLFATRKWKPGFVALFIGGLMWGISITPVSDALHRGLESGLIIPDNPQGDVIVLLGAGVYDRVPDISGVGAPTETMAARILTAVRLQKKLNIPIIVSGGKIYEHRSAEAPIVRRFLVDLGVPDSKIIVEDRSRDTIENAKFTQEICARSGYNTPILLTSAYHMKRALLSFKKTGIKVLPFQ